MEEADNAIEELIKHPDQLDDIDIDLFAGLLEENLHTKKRKTLYDIKVCSVSLASVFFFS